MQPSTPTSTKGHRNAASRMLATPPKTSRRQSGSRADAIPVSEAKNANGACKETSDETNRREEILDELDARGASGEFLSLLAFEEAELVKQIRRNGRGNAIGQKVREATLRILQTLVELADLDPSRGWFDAVSLVDAYVCLKSGTQATIAALPSVCAATIGLLRKADDSTADVKMVALASLATKASACYQSFGINVEADITADDIVSQERDMLDALEWRFGLPSVSAWLVLFADRFNILSEQILKPTVDWAHVSSIKSAGTLVWHNVVYDPMTPQQMAHGLFCTFMVVAGMVPLDTLKPPRLSSEEWEELYTESQCQGVPSLKLHDNSVPWLLHILTTTTGARLNSLQQDMFMVMTAMRNLLRLMRNPSRMLRSTDSEESVA